MKFKRQEAFRYSFGTPLSCHYQIIKGESEEERSSIGEAELLDVSLNGLKLATELDIPDNQDDLFVECTFTIIDSPITVRGKIHWKKDQISAYWYGIRFDANEAVQQQLVHDLKNYARKYVATEEE